MTTYILVIILLALVVIFQCHEFRQQRHEWGEEKKNLLDRIMSRNYEVYVNGEVVKEAAKNPDQIYEDQQERGIPI